MNRTTITYLKQNVIVYQGQGIYTIKDSGNALKLQYGFKLINTVFSKWSGNTIQLMNVINHELLALFSFLM